MHLEGTCTSLGLDTLKVQISEWFLLLHSFNTQAQIPLLQKSRKQNKKVGPIRVSQFSVWAPLMFLFHFPVDYTALPVTRRTYSTSLTGSSQSTLQLQKNTFRVTDGEIETRILRALC